MSYIVVYMYVGMRIEKLSIWKSTNQIGNSLLRGCRIGVGQGEYAYF